MDWPQVGASTTLTLLFLVTALALYAGADAIRERALTGLVGLMILFGVPVLGLVAGVDARVAPRIHWRRGALSLWAAAVMGVFVVALLVALLVDASQSGWQERGVVATRVAVLVVVILLVVTWFGRALYVFRSSKA